MSAYTDKKTLDVFNDVIIRIVCQAVDDILGVKIYKSRECKEGVEVEFLPSERVDVTVYVTVPQNAVVPNLVAMVQERVIVEIEKVTKYKVHNSNVTVMGVE